MTDHSLNAIALRTGTDKSDRHHGYTWLYEQYLACWRYQPITMLEIGVADGASLRMWREYFPHARIYGLDRDSLCGGLTIPGVQIFIGNQSNPQFLSDILRRVGPLNVVIDDGSHIGEDQISAFESLFPTLHSGGVYAVEDMYTSYWGWGTRSSSAYFKTLVDAVMVHGKSKCGQPRNDPDYPRIRPHLSYFEQHVESIHFHRGIVIIQKR